MALVVSRVSYRQDENDDGMHLHHALLDVLDGRPHGLSSESTVSPTVSRVSLERRTENTRQTKCPFVSSSTKVLHVPSDDVSDLIKMTLMTLFSWCFSEDDLEPSRR